MDNKNKIQTTGNKELAHLVQTNSELMGTDNIGKEDLIMPRIKVVQAMTKEKHESQPGEWLHNISGKGYGKEVTVIPIVHWKSNIMFNDALKIECRSYDGKVDLEGKSCNECGKFRFDIHPPDRHFNQRRRKKRTSRTG